MQKFALKLAGLGLVLTALFFTSCDPEEPMTNPLGPDIQFVSDPAVFSSDFAIEIGESFTVRVRLSTGDNKLNTLEITEGGSKLETGRFTVNAGAVTSNNPLLIFGTDKDGVTYDVTISPSTTQAAGDIATYAFTVADEGALTDVVDIVATFEDNSGPAITNTIMGVLLNQAGPTGTGGVDLDTGDGTGSSDASAELRDLGLDCTMNPGTLNWLKEVGTVNGAIMRKVDPTQVENFTFDAVDKVNVIIAAYDTGATLADGTSTNCSSGTETTVTNASAVAVDDVFAVFANDTYYLVRIDAVNENNTGNDDSYELSIKY